MNELSFDYSTGFTIYAARFQPDGNVFVSDGSADEAWATADSYDVVMTEDGVGGHYTGSFDTSSNIGAGVYPVAVYLQTGGSPANPDTPLGRGIMYWDGEQEENIATIGDQMDNLSAQKSQVLNVYEE